MKRPIGRYVSRLAVFALLFGLPSLALAQSDDATTKTETETKTKTKTTRKKAHDSKAVVDEQADNTGKNKRDRADTEPTADQQKNDKSDLTITAEIRRAIIADKSLSMNAHNVKIIAQSGVVTLKGPVGSAAEKSTVEQKAIATAGKDHVKSEIEIKP